VTLAVYEHPLVVRLCHWVNVVSLFVMVGSGLQIFRAFPSFGAKIPQKDLLDWPKSLALGGWLGGALQWHLTFMWIYIATGFGCTSATSSSAETTSRSSSYEVTSLVYGRWCATISSSATNRKPRKPTPAAEACIHLRDWAGRALVLTGVAIWKPVQFSWLAWMMGGFHLARLWHFLIMWAMLAFVFGHLVMVVLMAGTLRRHVDGIGKRTRNTTRSSGWLRW